MTGKTGIKYTGALALLALMSAPADAAMKQMEIKGGLSLAGYTVSRDTGAKTLAGGTDSAALLDADLDFKMKFSQDVTARLDLELDNAVAGSAAIAGGGERYAIGVDQAFFKMNDFLFKNFSLSVGKQNLNISLRDNGSFNWAWSDPIALVSSYTTRDMDLKLYWLKANEDDNNLTNGTNDTDIEILGLFSEYWINDDSLVIGYLNLVDNNAANAEIVHYGLGLDYFIGESLELYAEVAGQSIEVGAADGSAFQLNLGVEYAFSGVDLKPTFNLDYYLQSGSGATDPAYANVAGGAAAAENQSLYAEGNSARTASFSGGGVVAFAGSANPLAGGGYSAIRLNSWISPTRSTKIGLGFHMLTDEDDAAGAQDDLGLEIDLTAKWKYSQDVSFDFGAFLLSDSDVAEDITGMMAGTTLKF